MTAKLFRTKRGTRRHRPAAAHVSTLSRRTAMQRTANPRHLDRSRLDTEHRRTQACPSPVFKCTSLMGPLPRVRDRKMRVPGLSRLLVRMASTTTAFTSTAPPTPAPAVSTLSRASSEPMTVKSPLIYSFPMSSIDKGAMPIYLKLDSLQPSGSFKDRGMAHLCETLKRQGAKRLISSSGGNAGHSAAMCGRILGLPVTVIVPTTTKPLMLEKIKAQGAQVQVYGANWNAADTLARSLVSEDPFASYIPPYDHPLLWEGHSSIIDEIRESGIKPSAIVASVGGGGLLCGIYQGLERHGWSDVTVVATETEGAASFYEAFRAGRLVRLDKIDTVATSLGALEVTEAALRYSRNQPTVPLVVTDAEAVKSCRSFLTDHRMLVEPACGAALTAGYVPRCRDVIRRAIGEKSGEKPAVGPVVVVVCGGSGITPEILAAMEAQVDAPPAAQ